MGANGLRGSVGVRPSETKHASFSYYRPFTEQTTEELVDFAVSKLKIPKSKLTTETHKTVTAALIAKQKDPAVQPMLAMNYMSALQTKEDGIAFDKKVAPYIFATFADGEKGAEWATNYHTCLNFFADAIAAMVWSTN